MCSVKEALTAVHYSNLPKASSRGQEALHGDELFRAGVNTPGLSVPLLNSQVVGKIN